MFAIFRCNRILTIILRILRIDIQSKKGGILINEICNFIKWARDKRVRYERNSS